MDKLLNDSVELFGSPNLLLSVGLGASLLGLYTYFSRPPKAPLPPGPSSLPLIGNLHHYPPDYPWLTFKEWKYQFGDIVRLHGLGNEIIILNTLESINDLLVKQGHLYANRPSFTLATELMRTYRSMAMMSSTKMWQLHRKLAHTGFSQESVKGYRTTQEDIAAMMCAAMINEPERFNAHVRLATGRIIMAVTYGISPKVADQKYITHAEDTQIMFTAVARPGASIVDIIPALKYLPESTPFFDFHARAKRGRAMIEKMVYEPYEQVKSELTAGKALRSSYVSELLSWPEDAYPDREMFEEAVIWTAGALYGGGVDTTYATVMNAILAMAMYPDVQRAAQQELDKVIGDRFPMVSDRESTPYLNALIKEAMRWYPPVPLGLAHQSAEDFIYKGYLIPKNSIVIPNVWAVAYEPDAEFPPEKFMPERYLNRKVGEEIADPNFYIFGFGRRVCPGKYLAENSMYILIVSLIHCFSIKPPRDEAGNEIAMKPTWKASLTSFPNPFDCDIKPRSKDKLALCRDREAHVDIDN